MYHVSSSPHPPAVASAEKTFRECFLSWFFLWHLLWLSVMQLRHYFFIGTLNPMLQHLTNGEPSLGKTYTWSYLKHNERTSSVFWQSSHRELITARSDRWVTSPSARVSPQSASTSTPLPSPSCAVCSVLHGMGCSWTGTRANHGRLVRLQSSSSHLHLCNLMHKKKKDERTALLVLWILCL